MLKHFEITYTNGSKDWFTADALADYFENPEHWGRSKDSLQAIIKVELSKNNLEKDKDC